jgi:hypothetical protein
MTCPHCGAAMHTDRTHADWACVCGLAGSRDVLEALAVRLAKLAHEVEFWSVCCRDAERRERRLMEEAGDG